ncbi:hypothetical protein D3C80_1077240 [compost metagenome]
MVSDVEKQCQLRRLWVAMLQIDAQAAVVATGAVHGADPGHLRRFGQVGLAVEPHPAIAAPHAYREVGLMAQFGLQGRQARSQAGRVVDAFKHLAQHRQPTLEQLLVQLDEMAFTGAAEQQAGSQRYRRRASGKQQGQTATQGQSAHQASRSSST